MLMRLASLALSSMILASGCGGDDASSGPAPDAPVAIEPGWSSVVATVLATDEEYLYTGGEVLARIPIAGGAPETLYTLPATGELVQFSSIHPGPAEVVFVTTALSTDGEFRKQLLKVSKSGGPPLTLATSSDQRAFIGVTIDGGQVYYSSFTNLYRVPLAGGEPRFVGESPESIQYWIVSPTILGDELYWAEGTVLFKIAKTATGERGTLAAELGLTTRIIGSGGAGEPLVVALSVGNVSFGGALAFAEVDPATGMLARTPIELGHEVDVSLATADAVWGASSAGVIRVPRAGGAAEQLTSEPTLAIAASEEAVFAATSSGITRLAR